MTRRASLALAALVALAGCEDGDPAARVADGLARVVASARPTDLKLLLIGIDGASFRLIDPLLEEGRLPAFAGLVERGARGPLLSQRPMNSPAIWTTVATGFNRQRHGIGGFSRTEVSGGTPRKRMVSSLDRKTLALWNLLGPFQKSVGVVAWWASWPAEPVRGWIVSDRMARGRWNEWLDAERAGGLTYPPELAARLAPLVVDPAQPPLDEIAALARFDAAELAELEAARKPVRAHWLSVLKFAYCAQRSYENIALELLADGQPDLTAVYLVATDPISHTFWHFYEPEAFAANGVDPARAARLGGIVPAIYEHNDRYVARLLDAVDPDTVVFVVSDHGFEASGELPTARSARDYAESFEERRREAMRRGVVAIGQSGRHDIEGVLIAAGGPILPGVEVRAGVLDIAPTLLALLGLPVPDDMPGRVLEEMIDPDFLRRHPVQHIPSYEPLIARLRPGDDAEVDDTEALELLRALGYIE